MAFYSRFFGGPEVAVPEYNQEDDAEVFRLFFTSGIYSGVGNELQVVQTDPASMAVRLNTGAGHVYGRFCFNSSFLTKSLDPSDPSLPRIDRVVLRMDAVTNFQISPEILKGTPAGSPSPPTLTKNDSIYEISLAQVLVGAGVTFVDDEDITDEREYVLLGNADTVDSKHAADFLQLTAVQTATNKRITKRVVSIESSATPTPNGDITDVYKVTALAEAAEFAAPTGTPTDCQTLVIRIKDAGVAKALTWNAIYVGIGVTLPATTVADKRLLVGFMYNSVTSKWECPAAVAQEA